MHVRASELRGQVDGDTRGYWDLLVTGWGGKKKKRKVNLRGWNDRLATTEMRKGKIEAWLLVDGKGR